MAKMVLFSAMEGRVLHNGKPVAGAQIERSWRWSWKSENGADQTTTAADGGFVLPAVVRTSWMGSLLPHEPLVDQIISIQVAGKTYKAWAHFKRNYDTNGEHQGLPLRVTCRLESEPVRRAEIFGICEFD